MKIRDSKKTILLFIAIFLLGVIITGCSARDANLNQLETVPANAPAHSEDINHQEDDSELFNDNEGGDTNNGSDQAPPSDDTGDDNDKNTQDLIEQDKKKKVKAKALYLTGWTAGSDERIKHYIDIAKTTEINAYVIDIKDDDGYVGYESTVPAVREANAFMNKYNVDKVIKEFKDNDIYIIGRVVCFKDPVISSVKPEWGIKTTSGELWYEKTGSGPVSWIDPSAKESWPYLIDIAKEAVQKGFDEIQFDYIRFPTGNTKNIDYGHLEKEKYEYINEFIEYARKEMPDVVLSADTYGIICESPADTEDIGQYLEHIGMNLDYICPMVYPSHYAEGQIVNGVKYAKPDFEPYGVVYNTLAKAKERIGMVENYKAGVRPYLQDFTASWLGDGHYQRYGPEEVRQQIQAVYEAGYEEWILWDAYNKYSEAALLEQ